MATATSYYKWFHIPYSGYFLNYFVPNRVAGKHSRHLPVCHHIAGPPNPWISGIQVLYDPTDSLSRPKYKDDIVVRVGLMFQPYVWRSGVVSVVKRVQCLCSANNRTPDTCLHFPFWTIVPKWLPVSESQTHLYYIVVKLPVWARKTGTTPARTQWRKTIFSLFSHNSVQLKLPRDR